MIKQDAIFQTKSPANSIPKDEYISYLLTLPRGTSRLEKLGESFVFPKNHILVKPGQKTQYCYVLKRGRVISYEYSSSGEERIYHFQEKNSIFLESNLLFDRPVPVGFKTVCTTEVIRINKVTLLKAIKADPQIALDIIESNSMKFFASMEQVRQFKSHNASWKICNLLLVFSQHYGVPYDDKILIQEKISQQLLSSMLGINRITAVRAIKELKDMALIEQINGFYCIRDIEKLKKHQQMLEI